MRRFLDKKNLELKDLIEEKRRTEEGEASKDRTAPIRIHCDSLRAAPSLDEIRAMADTDHHVVLINGVNGVSR